MILITRIGAATSIGVHDLSQNYTLADIIAFLEAARLVANVYLQHVDTSSICLSAVNHTISGTTLSAVAVVKSNDLESTPEQLMMSWANTQQPQELSTGKQHHLVAISMYFSRARS